MTNELTLIKLLLNKEQYNRYNEYVDVKYLKDTIKELYYIYITLKELHEVIPSNISIDELSSYFYSKYNDADKTTYAVLFEQLAALDVSDAAGAAILDLVSAKQAALRLSEASFSFAQGFSTIEQVRSAAESLLSASVSPTDEVPAESLDLEEIINSSSLQQGIRWRLDFLNKSLGSLRDGDFGMLIKRPESGGTLFCADVEMYAVDQVDGYVVHFNNEEDNKKVILRMYMAYFGATRDQILSNWQRYNAAFKERVVPKYLFFGIDYCNKKSVESIISKYKPKLVVYDQMSKIKGFDNDRLDLKLGDTFQWARELTKYGHAAIAIHQADGSAEGQKWLDMGHVANAKTSIQAECDWILGMGKTSNPNEETIRYFNISKNKLLGDVDTIPELRHGRGEVIIKPDIMQFRDIISYG